MWGEEQAEGGKKEDSSSPRGRVDRLSQGRCLSLRKVAPFLPQPGMKRRKGLTRGTNVVHDSSTVACLLTLKYKYYCYRFFNYLYFT